MRKKRHRLRMPCGHGCRRGGRQGGRHVRDRAVEAGPPLRAAAAVDNAAAGPAAGPRMHRARMPMADNRPSPETSPQVQPQVRPTQVVPQQVLQRYHTCGVRFSLMLAMRCTLSCSCSVRSCSCAAGKQGDGRWKAVGGARADAIGTPTLHAPSATPGMRAASTKQRRTPHLRQQLRRNGAAVQRQRRRLQLLHAAADAPHLWAGGRARGCSAAAAFRHAGQQQRQHGSKRIHPAMHACRCCTRTPAACAPAQCAPWRSGSQSRGSTCGGKIGMRRALRGRGAGGTGGTRSSASGAQAHTGQRRPAAPSGASGTQQPSSGRMPAVEADGREVGLHCVHDDG